MAHTSVAAPADHAGFLIRESAEQYREKAKAYLSSHALADFRKCPLLFWKKRQGLISDEDRPAYALGRAAHKLILEGMDAFDAEYAVGGPINPKTGLAYGSRTKAYAEWAAAQDRDVLTEDQYSLVTSLAAGVSANDTARALLESGVPEGVARAEYRGVPCQSRLDWFSLDRGIADLKTCDDLTWFEPDARRYGYAHQMAFYQAVLRQLTREAFPVHVIAVEKKEPYRCGVWLMSNDVLAWARQENEAAIERLKSCEASGVWETGYEECRVFDYVS